MPKYYAQLLDREIGLDLQETADGIVVRHIDVEAEAAPLTVDFAPIHYSPTTGEGLYSLLADGTSYQLYIERTEMGFRVAIWRHRFDIVVLSEREWRLQKVAPKAPVAGGNLLITAPMPGLVKHIDVSPGQDVVSGQRLVVLEAMKMENDINAPRDGRVGKIYIDAGTVVEGGKPLVTLES